MDTHRSDDRAGNRSLILCGHDAAVARWVGDKVGIEDFGACRAIGIIEGNEIIAGIVYNQFRNANIEMTIASTSPRWCRRETLKFLFAYPFIQLGCRRVTAATEATNQPVRAFLVRLGFRHEGNLRQWFGPADAAVYGMLRSECRWLGDRANVATVH